MLGCWVEIHNDSYGEEHREAGEVLCEGQPSQIPLKPVDEKVAPEEVKGDDYTLAEHGHPSCLKAIEEPPSQVEHAQEVGSWQVQNNELKGVLNNFLVLV